MNNDVLICDALAGVDGFLVASCAPTVWQTQRLQEAESKAKGMHDEPRRSSPKGSVLGFVALLLVNFTLGCSPGNPTEEVSQKGLSGKRSTYVSGRHTITIETVERRDTGTEGYFHGYFPPGLREEIRCIWFSTEGTKPLMLPRSTFSDLSDIREVDFEFKGQSSRLTIRGGSLVEEYIATIEFERSNLVRRTVRQVAFPNAVPQEVTEYSP